MITSLYKIKLIPILTLSLMMSTQSAFLNQNPITLAIGNMDNWKIGDEAFKKAVKALGKEDYKNASFYIQNSLQQYAQSLNGEDTAEYYTKHVYKYACEFPDYLQILLQKRKEAVSFYLEKSVTPYKELMMIFFNEKKFDKAIDISRKPIKLFYASSKGEKPSESINMIFFECMYCRSKAYFFGSKLKKAIFTIDKTIKLSKDITLLANSSQNKQSNVNLDHIQVDLWYMMIRSQTILKEEPAKIAFCYKMTNLLIKKQFKSATPLLGKEKILYSEVKYHTHKFYFDQSKKLRKKEKHLPKMIKWKNRYVKFALSVEKAEFEYPKECEKEIKDRRKQIKRERKKQHKRDIVKEKGCHTCQRKEKGIKCCRCEKVAYCSKKCQKIDWNTRHRRECTERL